MPLNLLPLVGPVLNLFGAKKAQNREDAARAEAQRVADQASRDDRAAVIEQREYDQAVYARQRADVLGDYQRQRSDNLDDVDQQFVRLRAAAEKGGFNPLAVLPIGAGSGTPSPVGMGTVSMGAGVPALSRAASVGYIPPTDYMSSAMTDAALALADSFARLPTTSASAKLQSFQASKQRLADKVRNRTLRPEVGGVYAGGGASRLGAANADTGSKSTADGGSSAGGAGSAGKGRWPPTPSGWSVGVRGGPLTLSDPSDARRKANHNPVTTDSGLMKIDSPWFDPFYVPSSGGQPLDNDQLFSIGLGYVGTRAFEAYVNGNPMAWGPDGRPSGGKPGVPVSDVPRMTVDSWRNATRAPPMPRYTRVKETWGPKPKKTAQPMTSVPRW